jgi:hypothetical protein
MSGEEHIACPSCGGAGGGPFGRAGSAWDTEDYVCSRCRGAGAVAHADVAASPSVRPGVVKASPSPGADVAAPTKKQKASA